MNIYNTIYIHTSYNTSMCECVYVCGLIYIVSHKLLSKCTLHPNRLPSQINIYIDTYVHTCKDHSIEYTYLCGWSLEVCQSPLIYNNILH